MILIRIAGSASRTASAAKVSITGLTASTWPAFMLPGAVCNDACSTAYSASASSTLNVTVTASRRSLLAVAPVIAARSSPAGHPVEQSCNHVMFLSDSFRRLPGPTP